MNTEPVRWISLVAAAVRSGVIFALGMGWISLTEAQLQNLLAFGAAIMLVADYLIAEMIRKRVTPT